MQNLPPHSDARRVVPFWTGRDELTVARHQGKAGRSGGLAAAACALTILWCILLAVLPGRARAFTDVPPWTPEYVAVNGLLAKGALDGFPDGSFRPGSPALRVQFVKMVVDSLHLHHGGTHPTYPEGYMAAAEESGVAGEAAGMDAGLDPWAPIVWEEALSILVRAGERYLPRNLAAPPAGFSAPFSGFSRPDLQSDARIASFNGFLLTMELAGRTAADPVLRGEAAVIVWNLVGCFG